MRTRLLLAWVFAAATFLANAAPTGNIAHGVRIVVIDAGHGGKFPGAHYGGVYEKDLTLKVALKLGKLIEEGMPGVKVVYTRTTDKTLGADLAADLQARADIANQAGGDLFLSIHANAAPKATGVRGVETLIMGESSKEQRYNENALFENNREDLIDMSDERTAAIVRAYIQNLQFTYGEYSMAIARCIQNSYLKAGRHSRGVKRQLLRVLYATDMPSALTEIGFMTNPQELAYMKSEKGQNEIARSLYQAVRNYSAYLLGTRMAEEEQAAARTAAGERLAKAESAPAGSVAPEKRVAGTAGSTGEPAAAEKPTAARPATEKPTAERLAAEKPAAQRESSAAASRGSDRSTGADKRSAADRTAEKPAVAERTSKEPSAPDKSPKTSPDRKASVPTSAPTLAPAPAPADTPTRPASPASGDRAADKKPTTTPDKKASAPASAPAPAPADTPTRPASSASGDRAAGQAVPPTGTKAAPADAAPLRYTIQVLASSKPVPLTSPEFRSYRGKVREYRAEGRFSYKYGFGEFETRAAAQRKIAEVRKVFPGAFVVTYRGTQIVK